VTSSHLVVLAITVVIWLVFLFAPRVPSWLLWYPPLGRYLSRSSMAVIATLVLALDLVLLLQP
jgi:hypothetical protein